MTVSRRRFLQGGAAAVGGAVVLDPFQALSARVAAGHATTAPGFGPLVDRGDLWLPDGFHHQVLSRQGAPMSDGRPTPGIFDGMAAFAGGSGGDAGGLVLVRNHENRERAGEIRVDTGAHEYDPLAAGGVTKLVVRGGGPPDAPFVVERAFAVLGGTSTNCAGGVVGPFWVTCEEVVKRSANGRKHGYAFPVDSRAAGPVDAVPLTTAGRFAHEAVAFLDGVLYETEDRGVAPDPVRGGVVGGLFYRWVPASGRGPQDWQPGEPGILQALKVRGETNAGMDRGRAVGRPYPVEWVTIDQPDHDDDTDARLDRVPGLTPTRVQGKDKGAAHFNRPEGAWAGPGGVYFTCTAGGAARLGQVWEYDPGRQAITLLYESADAARLEAPDNVVVSPSTGDLFVQEDGGGVQHVRGLTPDGAIYDFARTATNHTEFCGGCFAPDGSVLFLNQQGRPGTLPDGPPGAGAVTYAIWGRFDRRDDGRPPFPTRHLHWLLDRLRP